MKFATFAMCSILLISSPLCAQEPPKPGAEHLFLGEMEGEWTVTSSTGDMTGKCVYKRTHQGLWVTSNMEMKMPEGPFSGTGLDSYDPIKKKYVSIWIDSMSTTPIILEGERSADGKKITMTGKGPSPTGTQGDYKTETEYVSKDKHVFKMWMGTLTGDPMMVLTYDRKK